jgi:hypothetical protein
VMPVASGVSVSLIYAFFMNFFIFFTPLYKYFLFDVNLLFCNQ